MPSEAHAGLDVGRRRPGLALLVALACWVPYVVGLVVPYYVNGVHRRTADQPIYTWELDTLWPYDTPLGGVVAFVTIVGMPTAPFLAAGAAMWSAFMAWTWRRTLAPPEVALYLSAALVALASIAWLATPLATELVTWFVD